MANPTGRPSVLTFVQARVNSTRFPRKVLSKLSRYSLLEYILKGLRLYAADYPVVVVTGPEKENRQVIEMAKAAKLAWFSYADEDDVMARFYWAAKKYKPNQIIRYCADNPFTDKEETFQLIKSHIETRADYSTNTKSVPISLAREAIKTTALIKAYKLKPSRYQREHVGPAFYQNPDSFKLNYVPASKKWPKIPVSLSIDTPEDLDKVKNVIKKVGKGSILDGESIRQFFAKGG